MLFFYNDQYILQIEGTNTNSSVNGLNSLRHKLCGT